MKNLSENSGAFACAMRRRFARLLWDAFPGASENAVAEQAAAALGCSERQVRNWLRCENDAGLRYVGAVMMIAGAEKVIQRFNGA